MTEELLSPDELTDRCWAVLAAAAEDRHDDVSELLETLPWPDLVTVVCGIGAFTVGAMAGRAGLDEATARADVAAVVRRELLERLARREGPTDG
ncbi:hypothetical protein [Streptomyces coelicoflavus]|uniref:hypothetical protein n=1 Tax=Streptomyces coelicoflavus TaxID=285562 RepID=UPI000D5A0DD9|nr:hypothetical protein [Streptomyces coelicoflavus]